jgi:hypothetical protein
LNVKIPTYVKVLVRPQVTFRVNAAVGAKAASGFNVAISNDVAARPDVAPCANSAAGAYNAIGVDVSAAVDFAVRPDGGVALDEAVGKYVGGVDSVRYI